MEYLDGFLLEKVIACAVFGGEEEEHSRQKGLDTAKTAVRLSSVCRVWRCVVQEILKSTRNGAIRQGIRTAGEYEATLYLCQHGSCYVRYVDISMSVFNYSGQLCDTLYQYCKNLESLDLSYGCVKEGDLSRCLRLMFEAEVPKIRRLSMAHAPDTAGNGNWIQFTPYLEELDVSFCHTWNPLSLQPEERAQAWHQMGENLMRLSLTGCEQFDISSWWIHYPIEFAKLKALDIAYIDSVTDENLMALTNSCTPSLVEISLTRNSFNNYNVGGYVSESTIVSLQSRNIKVSLVS